LFKEWIHSDATCSVTRLYCTFQNLKLTNNNSQYWDWDWKFLHKFPNLVELYYTFVGMKFKTALPFNALGKRRMTTESVLMD
jgi:hypothetical protein